MGVRVKGGMYCEHCERPVAAQKSTHRARGTAAIASGLWIFAAPDAYHCPDCGGPVVSERSVNPLSGDELGNRVLPWVLLIVMAAVLIGEAVPT